MMKYILHVLSLASIRHGVCWIYLYNPVRKFIYNALAVLIKGIIAVFVIFHVPFLRSVLLKSENRSKGGERQCGIIGIALLGR